MEPKVRRAKLILRLGLAAVFLYAAIGSLVSPNDWVGYLPHFATQILSPAVALGLFSAFELLLGLWLLSGKFVRYAAVLAGLTMVAIIVSDLHLFAITFRDIAIGAAAVALAVLGD
jgi:uncharacterized membrane protein YphA (DoxX/SURF4 family)